MASISDGGMFRQSAKLKGKGKIETKGAKPVLMPPPVSSSQYFRKKNMEASVHPNDPSPSANGAHSKEEDHFGFLYSMSEKDLH